MPTLRKSSPVPLWLTTVGAVVLTLLIGLAFNSRAFADHTNMSMSTSADMTQFCNQLGGALGGIPIPNGDVCDVAVVRTTPNIIGHDGMVLNKFTLMNSVLEFTRTGNNQVYVMGDFSLLESELNGVLRQITQYGWTITGTHNHMILESPKLTFVHWETMGDVNTITNQINDIINNHTSIHD